MSTDQVQTEALTYTSTARCFELKNNQQYGRYVVAPRDLAPGELILEEPAVARGPKQNSPPVCLGCSAPLSAAKLHRCRQCQYPLCSVQCERHELHQIECSTLSRGGKKSRPIVDNFDAPAAYLESIITLRVLALRESSSRLWERVMQMDSSAAHWYTSEMYPVYHHNVVTFLRKVCKVEADEKTLHKIGGLLVTNAFEARTPHSGVHVRCVFPDGALLAHSCRPNVHHTVDSQYIMYIRAATHIKKGEMLFTSYTHSMTGVLPRQEHLAYSKFFTCRCERCADPKEMGTLFSALRCGRCPSAEKGLVLPPVENVTTADWTCTHCSYSVKAASIRKLCAMLLVELDRFENNDPLPYEMYLRKYCNVLHPNHYLLFDAKHRLSQIYGRSDGNSLAQLGDVQLRRKIELCEEVVKTTQKCIPGIARITGLAHFELQSPLVVLAQRLYIRDMITRDQLRKRLETARDHLQKAVFMLSFEPEESLEGKIHRIAEMNLRNLDELIADTDKLPEGTRSLDNDDVDNLIGSYNAVLDLIK